MTDPIIRGYFTLVASMLLTAFFIFFALSPTFSTIVGLVRKIEDQEKIIAALDSKITNLIAAQESYSKIESKLPLLEIGLPTKPLPEDVLQEIQATATSAGVTITSLQIGDVYLSGINPVRKDQQTEPTSSQKTSQFFDIGLPTVSFNISLEGDEDKVRTFMGQLVNLPRILMITGVTISSDTNTENPKATVSTEVKGSAFYYPIK